MTVLPDGTGADAPFTDAALARLMVAYSACELADLARSAVPVGAHELGPDGTVDSPGSALAAAGEVFMAARQLMDAAAVYERVGGASWQLIADTLGMTMRTAQARFAAAESRFRAELRSAAGPHAHAAGGQLGWWRAHTTREPLEAAADLDDWVLRHADGDDDHGAAPVSGGLTGSDRGSRSGPEGA